MTYTEAVTKIQPTLTKFSLYASNVGGEIVLIYRKRELVGRIDLAEPVLVKAKYIGQRVMMGSIIRNELCSALDCASGKY